MRTVLNILFVLTLAASIDVAILYGIDAEVSVEENEITLKLKQADEDGDRLILGLLTHLYILSDEFQGRIRITFTEV